MVMPGCECAGELSPGAYETSTAVTDQSFRSRSGRSCRNTTLLPPCACAEEEPPEPLSMMRLALPFLRISYWRSTRFTCAKSSATFRMSFGFSTAGCGYGQTRSHAVNQRAVPKRQTESRSRVPRVFTPKRQHPGRRCKLSPCARARIMGIFRGFDGAC